MEGRHSSTDSNKASSGDVSPYDNNSPVLSERSLMAMQEDVALSSDKLYKVPEQYMLVGHLQSKSREHLPGSWAGKDVPEDHFNIWGTWHSTLKCGSKDPGMTGSYGNIYESSSLRPGRCSLSQGNLSLNWPRWQGSATELDNGKQIIRRSQTTAAIPECRPHPPVSRVCSTPQIEGGRRSSDQSNSRSERHLTFSSAEDLTERDSNVGCLPRTAKPSYLRQEDINRKERPPPPYPGPKNQSSALSQRPAVSSTVHSLWRLQRPEKSLGTVAAGGPAAESTDQSTSSQQWQPSPNKMGKTYSTPANNQNNKNVSEPDWHDWQRERWQIWELLSADNPDALPETLV